MSDRLVTSTPIQNIREYSGPLDKDAVFSTTAERMNYLTSPRRYAGQIVSDLEDESTYKLNTAKDGWIKQNTQSGEVTDSDSVAEGVTNKYFTEERVLQTVLTDLDSITITGDANLLETDKIIEAFAKLKAIVASLLTSFNQSGKLMKVDAGNKIPALDGSQITNIKELPTQTGKAGYVLSTDGQDPLWKQSTDALDFQNGIEKIGNTVVAKNLTAFWNANRIQGIPVSAQTPQDGQVLSYDASLNTWVLKTLP